MALTVLHEVANSGRFAAILWFSARDIDLLAEGPKLVKPQVLTEGDIAAEFARLMQPREASDKQFKPLEYLSEALARSPLSGGPLLFVFDNFETLRSPAGAFAWIETYVRLPNKVLITTRFRDFREFKGDYPVEVLGMTEEECEALVDSTASLLGIGHLLTDEYRRDLYRESDGHPYIVKVLLGEVARAQRLLKVERVVAGKEDMLDALFERTFTGLSPAARRVFLTLCNWRSVVPQLAVQAVMLRPANERMDAEEAIEELRRSSLIEVAVSDEDQASFLSVPLVASVFGRRKLAVNAMKSAVHADTEILRYFGSAQGSDVRHGIAPGIERMFRQLAGRIGRGDQQLGDHVPMLEFVARGYPPAWLLLASLYEEADDGQALENAKRAVSGYLESGPESPECQRAWEKLAELCRRTEDLTGEISALAEVCQVPGVPFATVSACANRLNSIFREHHWAIDTGEKHILLGQLIGVVEQRIGEADATDCSRLAWLCLHLHDEERARTFTKRGLAMDKGNAYCSRLAAKLGLLE